MLGARQGFLALVKEINPNYKLVHCFLRRQNFTAQDLLPDLWEVMQDIASVVNFFKLSAVNSHLFEHKCMPTFGLEFQYFPFYSNVRWVFRSKLLLCVVDLRTELKIFLNGKNYRHAILFYDSPYIIKVFHLNDIFTSVSDLISTMNSRDQNIITLYKKPFVFKEKLQF